MIPISKLSVGHDFANLNTRNCKKKKPIIVIDVKIMNAKYIYPSKLTITAGIDFSRQNLTSVDVKFWRPKSIPAL